MNLDTEQLDTTPVDTASREELVNLLSVWKNDLLEAKQKRNGHPGIKGLIEWVDRTLDRLNEEREPLDHTKIRVVEFMSRMHMLEGLPLELDMSHKGLRRGLATDSIQAAIERGKAKQQTEVDKKDAEAAERERKFEAEVREQMGRAAEWVETTLPQAIEEHTAKGKNSLRLDSYDIQPETLKEAIVRTANQIKGLHAWKERKPGPYSGEDTVGYYEVDVFTIEWEL